MALEIMKKVQDTVSMDPKAAALLKARREKLKDTTKSYSRGEAIETYNKIARGELKPKNMMIAPRTGKGKTTYGIIDRKGDTIEISKQEFEKRFKKP